MNWKLCAFLLLGWTAAGAAAALAFYQWYVPKVYISEAEIALQNEVLSLEGLASFRKVILSEKVELQLAAQLLTTPQVIGAAVKKVQGVTYDEVKNGVKVKDQADSPIIKLRVKLRDPRKAAQVAAAMIERGIELDGERREQRARTALNATEARLAEVRRELETLNGRIRQFNVEKGVTLSSDAERQQSAAMTIADCEQKLAAARVEEASLRNRLQQTNEFIAAFGSKGTLPSGFEFEDPEKSQTLGDARKKLLEQLALLASLSSRYGDEHPRVQSVNAEVSATKKTVQELLTTQRDRLATRIADNAQEMKILREKIAATESQIKHTDLMLDPIYVGLLSERESMKVAYGQLAERVSQLSIYVNAKIPGFFLFSEPTLPARPSLMQLASTVASGLLAGGVLGVLSCGAVLAFRRPARAPDPAPAAAH